MFRNILKPYCETNKYKSLTFNDILSILLLSEYKKLPFLTKTLNLDIYFDNIPFI